MKKMREMLSEKPWLGWVLFFATLAAVFLIALFASTVVERRSEAVLALQVVREIPRWEPRNEVWGENFPRQYESYRRTADTAFRSEHGGSAERDYLSENPRLVVLWAGYSFSKDYHQGRGHFHAVTDIRQTLRTGPATPGTCWTCKSTDVPRLIDGMGAAEFYRTPWMELGSRVTHPIGCQDCHDPATLRLRITRPALIEALNGAGVAEDPGHQEMRSLVCAQCHAEYYFRGDGDHLTFPWGHGITVEAMEAYYDATEFADWTHALSRAPMLKSQHPDYELYRTGVHASRGVSCADCHMPYRSEGGVKFTDHHVQSPLNNIANSCQVCHRESEDRLRRDVVERQDRVLQLRTLVEEALVRAHLEARAAREAGASEDEMAPVLRLIRHAQWRWDWVASANSLGFHSPVEAPRVLGTAIQKAQEARVLLAALFGRHGVVPPPLPDLSTKERAQAFIGLDMEAAREAKPDFLRGAAAGWRDGPPEGDKPERPR